MGELIALLGEVRESEVWAGEQLGKRSVREVRRRRRGQLGFIFMAKG